MASSDASSGVLKAATLAKESAQAVVDIIDDFTVAPPELDTSREHLEKTRSALTTLTARLTDTSESAERLPPLLQQLDLYDPLYSIKRICQDFRHSILTNGVDSRVSENEADRDLSIQKFNTELSSVHHTFTAVLVSINLIITSQSTSDQLDIQFSVQEADLVATMEHLVQGRRALKTTRQDSRIIVELQDLCRRTTEATKASHTKQTFGKMTLDKSWGMQGIVGPAQKGVEQTFGDMKGTENSRAFQGQIDTASFSLLFQERR
ncbi:hypothetical protein B0T10DRAFT_269889 [Thelonectria olida]|uniref:Fungal N-terminal domain-containing protein n=1 Tax=Thelonectria olida TaxID=1576542 RepID=A0A9P9APG0_9HYPO|nr:hypothetical protein B0T10DRAFT_269889 [Thelonectria olida]